VSSSGNATAGPTGPNGSTIPATSIIYGDGTPSSGTGQLDDTYIQKDTAIMYRKEVSQWVSKLDVGAVATYQTIDSDYWSGIGPPVTIKGAIDRIGLALYNASPNEGTPL
jgi:hypothetical protein